jgi:hypothetical protein
MFGFNRAISPGLIDGRCEPRVLSIPSARPRHGEHAVVARDQNVSA